MAIVRSDGLVIRALKDTQLKTFIQNNVFHQFWSVDKVWKINENRNTSFTDQYLLMPISIFNSWSGE